MSESVIPLPYNQENALEEPAPGYEELASRVQPVSPKLVPARFIANSVWWLLCVAACVAWHVAVSYWDFSAWWHLLTIPLYVLVLQSIVFTPRRTRALGYAIRENDILFRSGIMFRSLSVMPYGRVQDVEIEEGPIERRFGLSTVTLKSAAGFDSDVSIPGLEREESERIRDLVTHEASAKMAAL